MTTVNDDAPLALAYRVALAHPDNPLTPALICLHDEVLRQRAVIESLYDRVAVQSDRLARHTGGDSRRTATASGGGRRG